MKETKFRLWDLKQRQFIPNSSMRIEADGSFVEYDYWKEGVYIRGEAYLPDEGIIQQYTNFKDKNNKEIYESDIVKCQRKTGEELGVVFFSTLTGAFTIEFSHYDDYEDIFHVKNGIEVVGNVFENDNILPPWRNVNYCK